jgi:hypothetical protein
MIGICTKNPQEQSSLLDCTAEQRNLKLETGMDLDVGISKDQEKIDGSSAYHKTLAFRLTVGPVLRVTKFASE